MAPLTISDADADPPFTITTSGTVTPRFPRTA